MKTVHRKVCGLSRETLFLERQVAAEYFKFDFQSCEQH